MIPQEYSRVEVSLDADIVPWRKREVHRASVSNERRVNWTEIHSSETQDGYSSHPRRYSALQRAPGAVPVMKTPLTHGYIHQRQATCTPRHELIRAGVRDPHDKKHHSSARLG